jgi:hypothetical protein
MATPGLAVLSNKRVERFVRELDDQRNIPQQLLFLNRTAIVPAEDYEIMGRFTGYVQIADLIADDASAVTYDWGTLSFETTSAPNIKLGANFSGSQIRQLRDFEQKGGVLPDGQSGSLPAFLKRTSDGLLLGVRQRMEALMIAMHLDGLSYDRLGIKMPNVTWGMPSRLKVTLTGGKTWDNPTTATPVSDINALRTEAKTRYGRTYDRLTMSSQDFDNMIATTEFQNKTRMFLAPNVSFVNLDTENQDAMIELARRVIGNGIKVIELYDYRYWSKNMAGVRTPYRYLPVTNVILTSTQDDKDASVFDFADGAVTEKIINDLVGNPLGLSGGERGPFSYVTFAKDFNPAEMTQWCVRRGFPRRHELSMSAVLKVGSYSDTTDYGA